MFAAPTRASVSVLNIPPNSDAKRRVAVLVLGMHRSGTSALARMLSLLGCELPQNLLAASDGNPLGHWESDAIRWFNEELLAATGTYWDDWLPVNPGLATSPVWPSYVERGRAVVAQEFLRSPLFVLKDPRICRLAALWLEVLAAEEIEPVVVIPVRNPLEVARSLKARNDIDEGITLLTWLRHVLEAEASTRKLRRVVSGYEELLFGWKDLAAKLEHGLGITWPCMSPLSAEKIDDFIAVDHRHHAVSMDALGASSIVTPWITSTYQILQRWTRSGVDPADYATLDAIRDAFDAAAPAFARPLLAAKRRGEHALRLEVERDAARALQVAAEARVGDLTTGLIGMAGERDGVQATLTTASQELDAMRHRATVVEDALRQREDELFQANAAGATAANSLAEARELIRQAGAERLALQSELDQTRSGLGAARGELAGLREEAGRLQGSATQAQERAQWLADVHVALGGGPRWWALLPHRWRRVRELARLQACDLFDAETYLRQNSDVAAQGMDPLHHYIQWGMAEGRSRHCVIED